MKSKQFVSKQTTDWNKHGNKNSPGRRLTLILHRPYVISLSRDCCPVLTGKGGGVALGSPVLAVKVFTSLEGVVLSCFGLIWNTDFFQLVLKLDKCFLLLVYKVTRNFLPVWPKLEEDYKGYVWNSVFRQITYWGFKRHTSTPKVWGMSPPGGMWTCTIAYYLVVVCLLICV